MDSIPIREYTRVYNKERRIFRTTILERYEIRIVFWYHEKFVKVWFVSSTIHTHTAVEIASINTGRAFWGEILHLNFILNLAKYWRDQKSHKINHKWKNGQCWENWCENYKLRSTYFENRKYRNGILLPKLFWPTVRKNCSSDREKLLKFEAEGREFAKLLRSLEQFIQTGKVRIN